MKKLSFMLSTVVVIMSACSGSDKKEQASDNNIIADSLAQVDADKDVQKPSEAQATADSGRQDSIDNAEAFAKIVPTVQMSVGDYGWAQSVGSKLKKLGYSGSTKTKWDEDMDEEKTTGKYRIEVGDKSCSIDFEATSNMEFGEVKSKITINGDEDALNNLHREINKYIRQNGWTLADGQYHISLKGNTITVIVPSSTI